MFSKFLQYTYDQSMKYADIFAWKHWHTLEFMVIFPGLFALIIADALNIKLKR
jgi:hypothetical protein